MPPGLPPFEPVRPVRMTRHVAGPCAALAPKHPFPGCFQLRRACKREGLRKRHHLLGVARFTFIHPLRRMIYIPIALLLGNQTRGVEDGAAAATCLARVAVVHSVCFRTATARADVPARQQNAVAWAVCAPQARFPLQILGGGDTQVSGFSNGHPATHALGGGDIQVTAATAAAASAVAVFGMLGGWPPFPLGAADGDGACTTFQLGTCGLILEPFGDCPVRPFAGISGQPRCFCKSLVQGQIVPDGVL